MNAHDQRSVDEAWKELYESSVLPEKKAMDNPKYRVKLVIERLEDGDIRNSAVVIHCQDASSAQDFFHWADATLAEAFERIGDSWRLNEADEREEK